MILLKVSSFTAPYTHLHLSALNSILVLNSQITIANNLVILIVAYYKPINIILHPIEGVFLLALMKWVSITITRLYSI